MTNSTTLQTIKANRIQKQLTVSVDPFLLQKKKNNRMAEIYWEVDKQKG